MAIELIERKKTPIVVGGEESSSIGLGLPKGSAKWGKIIGDIHSQEDLIEELDEIRTLAYAGL